MKEFSKIKLTPTIGAKFIAVFIPFVALISIFIYVYFPHRLEAQALRFVADKAQRIIDMTAFNVSSTLVFADKNDMENIIRNVQQAEDIVYLVVENREGKVFGEFNLAEAQKAWYRVPAGRRPITGDGLIYRVSNRVSFKKKEIGEVFLGFSLKNLRGQVEKSKKTV
ncbi:MAG: hypothetical protein EHM45_25185, partial [Desulfobacteraceae bacterium]